MNKSNLIEVKNLVKVYRDGNTYFKALNGVSFSIQKGESVAIIGKSGSGKSTLMHLLAALDKPNEGEILINGQNIAKMKKRELNKLRNQTLEAVELTDKAKNKASNLSGGQKQRVCVARAIANSPKIIFADEPTGNLDSKTSKKIEDLLFGLNKESGITLIIVTHDESLAAKCDHQIRIQDGQIVSKGEK